MRSSGVVEVRIRVVGECFLDRHFHQLGGAAQAQATQLLDPPEGPHKLATIVLEEGSTVIGYGTGMNGGPSRGENLRFVPPIWHDGGVRL
jgi:hypothetical protein